MANISYRLMSFLIRHMKPKRFVLDLLQFAKVLPGTTVLDYACGPGVFTMQAAQLVQNGHVYATDIQPLALKEVDARAKREALANITTIQTSLETGLDDNLIDVVLLFDCIHYFKQPLPLLTELHRVLKPGGYLSVQVDHGSSTEFLQAVEESRLYARVDEHGSRKQYLFAAKK